MIALHICASWLLSNGAANIARMISGEQNAAGDETILRTWASIRDLRRADEVWIHCGWLPCLWWAALWGRNVKWMTEACYDPVRLSYHGWKKRLVRPIERFCLRRASAIVATCEAEKGWIQAYLGRRCPPVEVTDLKRFFDLNCVEKGKRGTENGCRVERVERAEEKISSRKEHKGDGKLHLLYLGRRHPLKGLKYLEEAVESLEFGVQSSELKAESGNSHLELKIVSNAFGDEKEAVWDWCDVLVLPTLSENFGLVIAEAFEHGKRVITTDGAPAWEPEKCESDEVWKCGNMEIWKCWNGEMLYLKGFRSGTDDERIMLLKQAIEAEAKQ